MFRLFATRAAADLHTQLPEFRQSSPYGQRHGTWHTVANIGDYRTALRVAACRSPMTTARGVRMGKGKPDAAVAFSAIASPLVDSAVEQAWHIAREPAAEGIHQLRVALRNLLTLRRGLILA